MRTRRLLEIDDEPLLRERAPLQHEPECAAHGAAGSIATHEVGTMHATRTAVRASRDRRRRPEHPVERLGIAFRIASPPRQSDRALRVAVLRRSADEMRCVADSHRWSQLVRLRESNGPMGSSTSIRSPRRCVPVRAPTCLPLASFAGTHHRSRRRAVPAPWRDCARRAASKHHTRPRDWPGSSPTSDPAPMMTTA
jgi:hypothetical protein